MADDDDFVTTRVTSRDIYEKQEKHERLLHKILEQAKMTNGRVTKLENKSIGMWIRNHPFKFAIFVMIFMLIVISDFRQPLVSFLLQFI